MLLLARCCVLSLPGSFRWTNRSHTNMASVSALIFKMTSHLLPTVRGPQHHYTEHAFDWQSLFDELDGPAPAPSIRQTAAAHGIPHNTLSRHYRNYRSALTTHNSTKLAVALGEIAGQRDNHRLFSRQEEKQLVRALPKENVHPNKPVIWQLALKIHKELLEKTGPANATRSHQAAEVPFAASDSFVKRVKRAANQNDHKPKLVKRRKKAHNPTEAEQEKLAAAFRDKVERAVRRVGGHRTINADEISGKMLLAPRTLWHDAGGPPPELKSNQTGKEAFSMILATSAAGHKLKPAVFVKGKSQRALKKWKHLEDQVALLLVDNRWVDQEMWDWYVEEVVAPFCSPDASAFVVDSHGPHISDFAGDVYAHNLLTPIQVPPGLTGRLQPNDVGVHGPLTATVSRLWTEQKRRDPNKWDGMVESVERYLEAWAALDRDTVRKAWVKAVPGLGALKEQVRRGGDRG